ncbi:hypothetical protein BCL80_104458 [Streptomyces avidinii]|nr:hypothetical protein BCL80_104458 [Streptomyces avidinii]
MVEADALEQFRLRLAVLVEELHQQKFLSRVQVQGAQHGGGVAAVGAGELEDGVAQPPVARRVRQFGGGGVGHCFSSSWEWA